MSPHRVLAVLVLAGAVTASGATAAAPGSSAAKADCSAQKRIYRKATGAKRATAKRVLKSCEAVTTANKRALKVVRGSHLVGTRGDSFQEDWTFCANGRYSLATTSGGSTGTSKGSR